MVIIPFVDAHVHLWDLGGIRYPWLCPPFDDAGPNGSVASIARDYLLADYLADAERWNVRGCVHIDAGAEPDQALAETLWLEGVAKSGGMPNAIVAFAPLQDPQIDALLEAQAAHHRVRGIRQIVNWHVNPMRTYAPSDATLDDDWWRGFGRLGRYGLSFDLQCYAAQMAGLAPLIQRHPDIPVIINHLGMPIPSEREGMTRWRYGLRAMAAAPHVSIKLSGLGFVDRNWTLDLVAPVLREVIDIFGTNRCMFASDSPTDTLFAPFNRYLEAYHQFAEAYSLDERRDLFGRNANRIYRLGLDVSIDMPRQKIAFRTILKAGQLEDYKRRHDAIWPDLVDALRAAGISDYSIHHGPDTGALFGVLWREERHGMDALPSLPVIQRWWCAMAPLMEASLDGSPMDVPLNTVSHLD